MSELLKYTRRSKAHSEENKMISMSDEFIEEFTATFDALIQKITSTLDQLIIEMNTILSGFDKQTVDVNRLKLLLENTSKTSSLNDSEFTLLVEFSNKLNELLKIHADDLSELYNSYQKLLDTANILKENFKSALTSVQKNFNLILKDWRSERKKLFEEKTSLSEEKTRLLGENKTLKERLEELQTAYNSLNKQFNELQHDYNISVDKLNSLQQSHLQLERDFKNLQTSFETIMSGFKNAYSFFKNLPEANLKLPSHLLLNSIREPLNVDQLNSFLKNLESLIELDQSLIKSHVHSKSFTTALTNNSYTEILNQAFKNILDVEERERNEIERRICEVEALINDAQLSRYIHTELFKPFTETARNLLDSNQRLLGEAAMKLIEQVKLKFEDVELRKTLIRRTGIRGLNLGDCVVESCELPLDVERVDLSLNNLLESLNTELFEKRRELSTFFFESWRDTALKIVSENKLVSYIILLIVKKLVEKANLKDSDLRKLFKKSLFLV